jgi:diguanylate cyclase (GGDEF)-like protein
MSKKAIVLIVSDSVSDTQVISTCIAQHYQFKTAINATQCIQIANHKEQPDLIVIDIDIQSTPGYEICKRLKSEKSTCLIPIIFVSNSENENMIRLGLEAGAIDFLTKPIIPALVISRINTHVRLKLQSQKLSEIACNDPLTGLFNRYLLADLGAKKVARAIRHKYNLWLLRIEIDNFNSINADYGRGAGDKLLVKVADMLKADSRREDIVACLTSEQFVMMFDPCGDVDAHNKALRISNEIGMLVVNDRKVTVSIGIAKLLEKDMDFEGLLKRSDDALHRAKENPLQRIEFAASY